MVAAGFRRLFPRSPFPVSHHGDWNLWGQFAALRVVALVQVAASAVIRAGRRPTAV